MLPAFQNAYQVHEENNMLDEAFAVVEPHEEFDVNRHDYLRKIITEFQEHLAECANRSLGYHVNLNCNLYVALSQLLRFHINNVGDPFHQSNLAMHSKKFEVGVLEWFAGLWGISKDEYWGYITNGGTEGNLQGLLLGRQSLPDGILYVSKETHYSVFKVAKMYKMEYKTIDTLTTGEIDCKDLREKLHLNKSKPAIINVNIGTTFKGGIDNIDLVVETLYQCGFSDDRFYIHCDAALNGLITPLLEQEPSLSFKKPIGSICVSAHKLLGSPMPCGVLMTRKRHMALLTKSVDYIASVDNTISGSRNGHGAVFMWYGLNIKGLVGLRRDVRMCLRNACYLRDRLRNAGIRTMLNENSIVVVFERPLDQCFVKYWQLSCVRNMAHVVVMPHVTTNMLDEFLNNLVQMRSTGYKSSAEAQPPCLAEEIGAWNCVCSMKHGKA